MVERFVVRLLRTKQDTENQWSGLSLHTHLDKFCIEIETMKLRMDADLAHFINFHHLPKSPAHVPWLKKEELLKI